MNKAEKFLKKLIPELGERLEEFKKQSSNQYLSLIERATYTGAAASLDGVIDGFISARKKWEEKPVRGKKK